MAHLNTGGAAFPTGTGVTPYNPGMTLRDYFAAKVMHQFLSGAVIPDGFDAAEIFSRVSVRAYEMADAMLKARGG